jgi:hypothetical protein
VLTSSRRDGPITRVSGFVGLTPQQVRRAYESDEDLSVIFSEDEVIESEVFVSDGSRTTFIKAVAVCETGSELQGAFSEDVIPSKDLPPRGTARPSPSS